MNFQEAKRRSVIFYLWMNSNEKGLNSLVQTIHVLSEDIGMEYGIEKCAMLVIEKGKIVKSVGIKLPDGKVIKSLQEGESYHQYLGILEADRFSGEEIKLKVSKKYFRRLRKVLTSKLNSGNISSIVVQCPF